MESRVIDGRITTIYQEEFDGESRAVTAMIDFGGYLLVGERSEGDLTMASYGSPCHYHQVVIAPESIKQLKALFRVVPQESEAAEIMPMLQHFFAATGAYLSEFMDALDAAAVPYGYLPSMGTASVSYRPARRADGSSY